MNTPAPALPDPHFTPQDIEPVSAQDVADLGLVQEETVTIREIKDIADLYESINTWGVNIHE